MRKKVKKFGDYVFEKRKERGLSQDELGSLIKVNGSTICRIENGSRRVLGYKLVYKLKKELDITEPDEGFIF